MRLTLSKMRTEFKEPIQYSLNLAGDSISINSLLHKRLRIKWDGVIICRKCKKHTKKSFGEGFCYNCFISAPEASPCILKPELCEAHLGKGRDLEYEEKNHNQPHIVYLAATDKVKVGVTRETQVPTRWIDQGAHQTIVLARTPNRYLAGVLEVALKALYTDKTNWRSMLKNIIDSTIDLEEEKWSCCEVLPNDLQQYFTEDDSIFTLHFPTTQYPEKIQTLNLLKQDCFEGILTGIKGQYLIFDHQTVFNVRRHTSFEIELHINE
jgi:hypothetical protein